MAIDCTEPINVATGRPDEKLGLFGRDAANTTDLLPYSISIIDAHTHTGVLVVDTPSSRVERCNRSWLKNPPHSSFSQTEEKKLYIWRDPSLHRKRERVYLYSPLHQCPHHWTAAADVEDYQHMARLSQLHVHTHTHMVPCWMLPIEATSFFYLLVAIVRDFFQMPYLSLFFFFFLSLV